jgi:hypothetical protein
MPGLAFGPSVRLSSRRSLGGVEWVKVEDKADEGRKVIVRRATVKWEGFESFMLLWTKLYGRI